MKSIYLNNEIHNQLKFLATLERKSLTKLVEDFLIQDIRKKFSDLPAETLQKLAMAGGSFDFLDDLQEDIYTSQDGVAV